MKVLITGSSTGFGKLIAETLVQKGHDVAASMRNVGTKNKENAAALEKAGAKVVEIDVLDEASVNAGVAEAVKVLGGLDVVVNNAGAAMLGLTEAFSIEDWKKVFDLNVFGVQRVNRAALPHLREQGSGLLVHVSSIIGRVMLPFFGPYGPSKWALEGLAEITRVENASLGIDSVLVEPGGFATEIFNKLATPSDKEREASLGEYAKVPMQFAEGFGEQLAANKDQKPQDVADAIVSLIEMPAGTRPFRTVVDKMGMATLINPVNEDQEILTKNTYSAFDMSDMLKLNVKEKTAA